MQFPRCHAKIASSWPDACSVSLEPAVEMAEKANGRRLRLHPKVLLATGLLALVAIAWFAVRFHRARTQAKAVTEIKRLGGWVFYDCRYTEDGRLKSAKPAGPRWLRRWLGADVFGHVHGVRLTETANLEGLGDFQLVNRPCHGVTDAAIAPLATLIDLEWLALNGAPVTDDGIAHLARLSRLQRLWLDDTNISSSGLRHLSCLTVLKTLSLRGTGANNSGLEHIQGLHRLEILLASNTKIGDAGLVHLRGMHQLTALDVDHTDCTLSGIVELLVVLQNRELADALNVAGLAKRDEAGNVVSLDLSTIRVTDAGLRHLASLDQLQWLYLNGTEVTDIGLTNLERLTGLTLLHLADTAITDAGLEHLAGLTNLRTLHLSRTAVTDAGIEKLKQTLPETLRIYGPFQRFGGQLFTLDNLFIVKS